MVIRWLLLNLTPGHKFGNGGDIETFTKCLPFPFLLLGINENFPFNDFRSDNLKHIMVPLVLYVFLVKLSFVSHVGDFIVTAVPYLYISRNSTVGSMYIQMYWVI